MPKTVEGLVRNHQAAAALRSTGKPAWSATIHLGAYYIADSDVATDHTYAEIGKSMARYLRGVACIKKQLADGDEFNFELSDLLDGFECISTWQDEGELITAATELASHMDQLYDWCDANRVWVDTQKFRPSKEEFLTAWNHAGTPENVSGETVDDQVEHYASAPGMG